VKEEATMAINRSQPVEIKAAEIKWVLTVPAIWKDAAKVMPSVA